MEDPKKELQSLSDEELDEIVGGVSRKNRKKAIQYAIELNSQGRSIAEMNVALRERFGKGVYVYKPD